VSEKNAKKKPPAKDSKRGRYGYTPEELLAMMTPEQRALDERIEEFRRKLERKFGGASFNVDETIREIRDAER